MSDLLLDVASHVCPAEGDNSEISDSREPAGGAIHEFLPEENRVPLTLKRKRESNDESVVEESGVSVAATDDAGKLPLTLSKKVKVDLADGHGVRSEGQAPTEGCSVGNRDSVASPTQSPSNAELFGDGGTGAGYGHPSHAKSHVSPAEGDNSEISDSTEPAGGAIHEFLPEEGRVPLTLKRKHESNDESVVEESGVSVAATDAVELPLTLSKKVKFDPADGHGVRSEGQSPTEGGSSVGNRDSVPPSLNSSNAELFGDGSGAAGDLGHPSHAKSDGMGPEDCHYDDHYVVEANPRKLIWQRKNQKFVEGGDPCGVRVEVETVDSTTIESKRKRVDDDAPSEYDIVPPSLAGSGDAGVGNATEAVVARKRLRASNDPHSDHAGVPPPLQAEGQRSVHGSTFSAFNPPTRWMGPAQSEEDVVMLAKEFKRVNAELAKARAEATALAKKMETQRVAFMLTIRELFETQQAVAAMAPPPTPDSWKWLHGARWATPFTCNDQRYVRIPLFARLQDAKQIGALVAGKSREWIFDIMRKNQILDLEIRDGYVIFPHQPYTLAKMSSIWHLFENAVTRAHHRLAYEYSLPPSGSLVPPTGHTAGTPLIYTRVVPGSRLQLDLAIAAGIPIHRP